MKKLEQQLLDEQGFQILRVLGIVYQVYKEKTGVMAAKIMKEEDFDFCEWQAGIKLTKGVQNPFVLEYDSINVNKNFAVILMEYANLGSISDIIESKKIVPIPIV
ncbi:MAG: hypothetical protein EZS28_028277 [Streblomastix strix]|uniref:Protein kinase domain-containing protein n=1 Tax=Streblomastix strix TaxID=222440 RepID=A0A5J4V2C3_9EUKA|nr:MAG: hypothetical protein EZS28_028277 [Streblomastix strix]